MDDRLHEIIGRIIEFRDERDWEQFHDPKNLAEAISIESAELLEEFLWMTTNESRKVNGSELDGIKEEVSDIVIFIVYLCNSLGIDLLDEVENKLEINRAKYPVEKSKGSSRKYTEV